MFSYKGIGNRSQTRSLALSRAGQVSPESLATADLLLGIGPNDALVETMRIARKSAVMARTNTGAFGRVLGVDVVVLSTGAEPGASC